MLTYETLVGEDLDLGTSTTTKTDPGGGSLPGTQISIASFGLNGAATKAVQSAWAPATVPAGQSVTTTVTVQGAILGDFILPPSFSLSLAGLILSAYVSAPNTVTLVLSNPTTADITLASGTLRILVLRAP